MTIDARPTTTSPTARPLADPIAQHLHAHRADMETALKEWVRIPSIAAQPERANDVQRSARWLAGACREIGLSSELIETGNAVAVFAHWHVDDALPTVLVYSHHDVRHAKSEEWSETSPFEPVIRDGRLYGRGASDAKGQVIAHLSALRAHLSERPSGVPAVNLKFLIEGEEEIGSPHLATLLGERAEKMSADVVVFSDTLQWAQGNPAVVTSIRGMITATLTVFGPKRDVHSGALSGASPNPSIALVKVLAQLHDGEGRIALPHFYDSVQELGASRAREFADLPFDDPSWKERTETSAITGERGFTVLERLWARPALEILSLLSGDPGGIPRAVIPSEAKAEMNIRTVVGQRTAEVAEQLRSFVDSHMPAECEYELQIDEEIAQEPYVTPSGIYLSALENAAAKGYGTSVVGRMGNAGGGPAELLARVLNAPILFVGTGLPEDHWHSSDESVDIQTLVNGAATLAHLWDELGRTVHVEDQRR